MGLRVRVAVDAAHGRRLAGLQAVAERQIRRQLRTRAAPLPGGKLRVSLLGRPVTVVVEAVTEENETANDLIVDLDLSGRTSDGGDGGGGDKPSQNSYFSGANATPPSHWIADLDRLEQLACVSGPDPTQLPHVASNAAQHCLVRVTGGPGVGKTTFLRIAADRVSRAAAAAGGAAGEPAPVFDGVTCIDVDGLQELARLSGARIWRASSGSATATTRRRLVVLAVDNVDAGASGSAEQRLRALSSTCADHFPLITIFALVAVAVAPGDDGDATAGASVFGSETTGSSSRRLAWTTEVMLMPPPPTVARAYLADAAAGTSVGGASSPSASCGDLSLSYKELASLARVARAVGCPAANVIRLVRRGNEAGEVSFANAGSNTATGAGPAWDAIGGYDGVRKALRDVVELPLTHGPALSRLGIRPPRGVVLHGPSGCGKSAMVRALVADSGRPCVSLHGGRLLSAYLGESERRVRAAFAAARARAPSMIFIDELDAVGQARGGGSGGGGGAEALVERVVSQMLTEMDGLTSRGDVIIVACTSRKDLVDPALLRPGRLDRTVAVGYPSPDDRAAILVRLAARLGTPPIPAPALSRLVEASVGFSGADLELSFRAGLIAGLKRGDAFAVADLVAAVEAAAPFRARRPQAGH